ncbi:MAG: hypothetical protein M3N10_04485 [Actinomycetota bacterium]|nr:hypothetical protein [Actinomycetota bacterium]
MIAKVRIRPEVLTEHRFRIEMYGLEDEDIENTIRMKGWAWVRARQCWAYAGEPDFIYRQIREVIIGLPDIYFIEDDLEESVKTVEMKARSDEEREEGRELLRQAFDKTSQPEGKEFIGN